MINKDTQLCISIAERPSNFGTTLHNMAYTAMNLNFIYKALAISDVEGAITGVRALGIRGCSISMPFKERVIPYIDELDETAKIIGAVNTVVNDSGHLIGYNTDVLGAMMSIKSLKLLSTESVLILGAGGVAKAIIFALKHLGITQIRVANRNLEKIYRLNSILPCIPIAWSEREAEPVDIIINATSMGMHPNQELMPLDREYISKARAVMDVVISPMETLLVSFARSLGKEVAPGYLMSLEQTMCQFKLYTGIEAPRALMEENLKLMLDQTINR